jgi:hypothetical protein
MKKSVSMVQEAPEIAALQNAKLLPPMEPIVFHYMMVSLTAMFAEFAPKWVSLASLQPMIPERLRAIGRQ